MKNVALFGKSLGKEHIPLLESLILRLHEAGVVLWIYEPFYKFPPLLPGLNIPVQLYHEHLAIQGKVDLLISFGGDGTLLDTLTLVRDTGTPVLGVNLGRLGFLSSTSKEELLAVIDRILQGEYSIDFRTLVQLESPKSVFGEINYALNELTVYKKAPMSMVLIHTYLDDDYLNSYWADGLVVSTPTGSTAYSMSCGGPILTPTCGNFVITPIASHNLTVRPMVVPDTVRIRIKVESRQPSFLLNLDSRSVEMSNNTELLIRKADFGIKLLQPEGKDFFKAIRDKLNWGLDIRN